MEPPEAHFCEERHQVIGCADVYTATHQGVSAFVSDVSLANIPQMPNNNKSKFMIQKTNSNFILND